MWRRWPYDDGDSVWSDASRGHRMPRSPEEAKRGVWMILFPRASGEHDLKTLCFQTPDLQAWREHIPEFIATLGVSCIHQSSFPSPSTEEEDYFQPLLQLSMDFVWVLANGIWAQRITPQIHLAMTHVPSLPMKRAATNWKGLNLWDVFLKPSKENPSGLHWRTPASSEPLLSEGCYFQDFMSPPPASAVLFTCWNLTHCNAVLLP
jgi:hypothetical protein